MLGMKNLKKLLMALAALAALAFGGAAIADATSNDSGSGEAGDDGDDVSLLHTANGDRAGAAAMRDLSGDKLVSVERTDEDSPAYYEVKVVKAGKTIEAQVDKSFAVTSSKADDDEGDDVGEHEGDDDGEHEGDSD
jgi:hypothetical protein